MFKKILIVSFFIGIYNSFGQRSPVKNLPDFDSRPIHYGFYLGTNMNDFNIDYKPSLVNTPNITTTPNVGFNVGLIADLRLHNNINLRFGPGLISNTKTLTFNHIEGDETQKIRQVSNTYLHVPFVFKFSTNRLNNFRPYVLTGVSYDYNFSSNQRNADDNSSGEFRQKTSVLMYEIGIGIDFYLSYFKFSPSIRGLFAVNNELIYDNKSNSQWTDPISFMGTRGLFLHFAFE